MQEHAAFQNDPSGREEEPDSHPVRSFLLSLQGVTLLLVLLLAFYPAGKCRPGC